jgi:hypothetical protein
MNSLRFFLLLNTLALLMGTAGSCSLFTQKPAYPNEPTNFFVNSSFEFGKDPWFALSSKQWEGFSITTHYAQEGKHSAYLALRADSGTEGSKVFGLIQEVSPKKFPKKISGYYRVEHWQRGTAKQYLQFVVIVQGDPTETRFENYQIRYVLAGIDQPALKIQNAKYLFLGSAKPVQGEWVYFERDVQQDFQKLWGRVPPVFTKLRLLFEARYDEKKSSDAEVFADVYYDTLYLGL